MSIIGVCGSRRRNSPADYKLVRAAIRSIYQPGDRFVSGGCPTGADRFAELLARDLGAPILIYHADWKSWGRYAGPHRNTLIAHEADCLIACVAPDRTGGTEDTIRKFEKHSRLPAILC